MALTPKAYKIVTGVVCVCVTVIAVSIYQCKTNKLSSQISAFLHQGKTRVVASDLWGKDWRRLCLVPGSYNPMDQSEIDVALGGKGLVDSIDLGDNYDLYVVSFATKTTINFQRRIDLQDTDNIVCTTNSNAPIILSETLGELGIKNLKTSFEERYNSQ
jgi:hypothetical protein